VPRLNGGRTVLLSGLAAGSNKAHEDKSMSGTEGTAPKRRTSHSKKNQRRAHDALTPVNPTICSNCGEPVMPHRICRHCGFYRGRKMLK